MRRVVPAVAAVVLLAGPTALAFFSGGYFPQPRLIAGIVAWALVLALAAFGPSPMPRDRGGRIALAGLVLMTVWSAVSISWAPLRGPAVADVQRLLLYIGVLLVALGTLQLPRAARAVEPALAAGSAIVIGYGLAGRLLPGIVELERSRGAGGRLEQPLTYWNAEGALAAVGLVLCARLAGDRSRPGWMRAAAAAALAPLGAGVYLSYSRGAIAAAVLGLLALVAWAPFKAQLRAAAIALAIGVLAALGSAALPGVASLEGTHQTRDGLIGLALLVVLAATGAVLAPRGQDAALTWANRLKPAVAIALTAVVAGLVIAALGEKPTALQLSAGANASRLTTASSYRYEYWRIGLKAFADHPLQGLGAGGFRVQWLKERDISENVRDTHSIEIEMATELGVVGLLSLVLLIAGVVLAGREALRRDAAAAAGACAAALTWLLHASIDWDWEMPAVSLPAIVLAGALISAAGAPTADRAARERRAPAEPSPDRAPG
jgi:hypothetical protein